MRLAVVEAQHKRQYQIVGHLQRVMARESSGPVEVMETHLSWLFLTAHHVIKLKKALHYSYLDYSTVEVRRRQCEAEVRLNRRLAPEVYLGVSAVTEKACGELALDGPGTAVEHVVRMRRLPAERSLDRLLQRHTLTAEAIDSLASSLARFYVGLPGLSLDPVRHLENLHRKISEDSNALTKRSYGLDCALVLRIAAALHSIAHALERTLSERVLVGRIVEGHGDLRPEHVYFAPDPVVDCLEFNRSLRTLDAVDEISFLAMECDRCGAAWVKGRLLRLYTECTRDDPSEELCRFFMAGRAVLWAKLAVWHLDRKPEHDRDKWISRAAEYLTLARGYIL